MRWAAPVFAGAIAFAINVRAVQLLTAMLISQDSVEQFGARNPASIETVYFFLLALVCVLMGTVARLFLNLKDHVDVRRKSQATLLLFWTLLIPCIATITFLLTKYPNVIVPSPGCDPVLVNAFPKIVARELGLSLLEQIAGQPITPCVLAEGNIVLWSFRQGEVIRGVVQGISALMVALFVWSFFELVRYLRNQQVAKQEESVTWPGDSNQRTLFKILDRILLGVAVVMAICGVGLILMISPMTIDSLVDRFHSHCRNGIGYICVTFWPVMLTLASLGVLALYSVYIFLRVLGRHW